MTPMQIFGIVLTSSFWLVTIFLFLVCSLTTDKRTDERVAAGTILSFILAVVATFILACSFSAK
jgi:uncharacterized PurR-regulated membrane protein YhhQ (DUF165 family)